MNLECPAQFGITGCCDAAKNVRIQRGFCAIYTPYRTSIGKTRFLFPSCNPPKTRVCSGFCENWPPQLHQFLSPACGRAALG
jgi:hypothetical protein